MLYFGSRRGCRGIFSFALVQRAKSTFATERQTPTTPNKLPDTLVGREYINLIN